jgi:hypothetical protein
VSTTAANHKGDSGTSPNRRYLVISLIAFSGAVVTSILWHKDGGPRDGLDQTLLQPTLHMILDGGDQPPAYQLRLCRPWIAEMAASKVKFAPSLKRQPIKWMNRKSCFRDHRRITGQSAPGSFRYFDKGRDIPAQYQGSGGEHSNYGELAQ